MKRQSQEQAGSVSEGQSQKLASFARYATSCAKSGSSFMLGAVMLLASKEKKKKNLLHVNRERARLAVAEAWESSVDAGLGAMRGVSLGMDFDPAAAGVHGSSRAVAGMILLGGSSGVAKVAESIAKARTQAEAGSLMLGLAVTWLMATSKSGVVFGQSKARGISEEEAEGFKDLSEQMKSQAIHSAAMLLPAASRRVMAFERPWEVVHAFNDCIDLMGRDPKAGERGGDWVLSSIKASLMDCDIGFLKEWAKFSEYAGSGMGMQAKDWAAQVAIIMEQKKQMQGAVGEEAATRPAKRSASL